MAAFRSTCLLFCATVLCGLAASTRVETDLAAEEAAGAVAPSLALASSVVEPVERMVREADPNPGNKNLKRKGKGKIPGNKKNKNTNKKRGRGNKTKKDNRRNPKNKSNKKDKNIKKTKNNKESKRANKGRKGHKSQKKGRGRKANKGRKGHKSQKKSRGRKAKKDKKGQKTQKKGRGRKNRKSKGKKNMKNAKNQNKTEKKKKTRTGKGGKRQLKQTNGSTIALTCLTTAIRLLKFQKDNVANFLTRHARQQKQNALTTKKSGKKGQFAEPSARLVQAGGGDLKNLSCSGSTTNAGAKNLKNITERLGNCQKGIQDACKPPTGINQTFMEICYNKTVGFNKTLTGCVMSALSGADACECFTEKKLVFALTDLKTCKGDKEAKMAAATRNKCLAKVRECNADVTKAGTLQYSCKITTDEMMKTLAQIMNNNATVTAAMDKIKALTGVSNSGPPGARTRTRRAEQPQHRHADEAPEIPDFASRHSGHRVKRQATTAKATTAKATTAGGSTTTGGSTTAAATTTAAPTCGSITTIATACAAAITNTPAMGDAITAACTIVATTITCSTAEKAALQASVDSVRLASRIFMAFSISLQSELQESSGTTASPAVVAAQVAALPGNAGATAAAAGRNRNILRKMIMDRLRK